MFHWLWIELTRCDHPNKIIAISALTSFFKLWWMEDLHPYWTTCWHCFFIELFVRCPLSQVSGDLNGVFSMLGLSLFSFSTFTLPHFMEVSSIWPSYLSILGVKKRRNWTSYISHQFFPYKKHVRILLFSYTTGKKKDFFFCPRGRGCLAKGLLVLFVE